MEKTIRNELRMDMLDGCMPVGEIESCLNHWSNKYEILRKSELTQLKAENERLKAELNLSKVSADYLYKDWLKATKRTGSVLLGSSVRDFIQYLDSHFTIITNP